MSFHITKILTWILTLLYWCHLSFAYLSCGNCTYGTSLVCPDYFDQQFEVYVAENVQKNEDSMSIKCSSITDVDFSLLEGCSFPKVNFVKFHICPLTNESFADTFRTIGVSVDKVTDLSIYIPVRNTETLTANKLAGLTELKFLNLEYTNFKSIDPDTFLSTPDLRSMFLRGNNIHQISNQTFQPLKNISTLNLNHNNFTFLPPGIFDNLRELKNLYLWNNNLNNLPPKIFDHLFSLQNLTLLENNLTLLDENIFAMNANLTNVDIKKNGITYLPDGLFRNCSKLTVLKLAQNKIDSIAENIFATSVNLKELDLSKNKLTSLNESLFSNLSFLLKLDLSNNYLRTLPEQLFASTKAITTLNLKNNLLQNLPMEVFNSAVNLTTLNLNNNSLQTLPEKLFFNTVSLENLDLSRNKLTELSFNTFHSSSLPILKKINLSYNNLTSEGITVNYVFALNTQLNLEIIDFSYNQFVGFPAEANIFNFLKLKKLNFEGNIFTGLILDDLLQLNNDIEVNVRFNKIKTVIIDQKFENKHIKLYLEGNNFTCNCLMFDVISILKHDDSAYSRFSYSTDRLDSSNSSSEIHVLDKEKLVCQRPSYLVNQSLLSVDLYLLTCSLREHDCSSDCPCFYRNLDNMVTVNCELQNLDHIPNVTYIPKYNYTLNLNGNTITSFNLSSNILITNLTLSNNNISSEILANSTTILPPNLRYFDLKGNNLAYLNQEFLSHVNQTGTYIDLTDNPWICDCEIKPLHKFVQEKYRKVIHFRKIECKDKKNVSLVDLKEEEYCPYYLNPMVLTSVIVFIILLVIFAIIGTMSFYKYKTRIKVWLYTHRCCLWLVTEDELDIDKQFDAFISYSHKDEDFVTNILVPELENGDPRYRLCLHYRDWMAGEFIQNQIMNSVLSSRRTLVILSSNFIESVWGQMEFRAAHQQALEDKTNRVIVIVYGEMPNEETLDEELLHYVKAHTYLKWGNPRFWESLRYAMPHPQHLLKKKKNKLRTEKLELVNGHVIKDNAVQV